MATGAAQAAQRSDIPTAVAVLSETELVQTLPQNIEDILQVLPPGVHYRFGDDPTGEATLGVNVVPFADPDLFGGAMIDPGDVGFGNTLDVITRDSLYSVTAGDGLTDDKPYVFFVAGRSEPPEDEFEDPADLTVQIDYPIGIKGQDGWVALDAFPGDTWQGASVVLSAQMVPEGEFVYHLIDAQNEFALIPFDGFFAAGADWTIAAVDYGALMDHSGGAELSYGYASHVHDGSYGRCDTCLSSIVTYPEVPRTESDLFGFPEPISLVEAAPPPPPPPSSTTTTSTTTPTTTEPTPVTSTSPGDDPAAPVDGGGGGSIPWIPIGIGLLIAGAGAGVYFGRKKPVVVPPPPGDCDPLLRKWKDLERQRETAEEFLGSAYEAFQGREQFLHALEAEKASYSKALEGPRGGVGGLDMVRLDGQMIQYDGLQEMIQQITDTITEAQAAVSAANSEVEERLEKYNTAVEAENAARAEYEACIQAASTPPSAPDDTDSTGGSAPPPVAPPTAPGVFVPPVSTTPSSGRGCKGQPSPVQVPVGIARRFKLYTDFDVIVTEDAATGRGSDKHGEAMSTGLKQAGLTLGTIGDILSGGGGAGKVASSTTAFQSGKLVKGSVDAVTGGASVLGAADVIPSVPTSLPEAVVAGLEATANLGAFIVDTIMKWMGNNKLVYIRPAYFYQTVQIQPTEIWECRDDVWRCVTRVNVYDVGNLQKDHATDRGPYSKQGSREQYKTQREIRRLTSTGRGKIVQSAKALADWEKANPPGDCT